MTLVDEQTKAPLTVHQVFVRLSNDQTKEEIIFVAEQDTTKAFKFDMDVGARVVPILATIPDTTAWN